MAAVHQAVDAFARVAGADLEATGLADRAGRLYVTTRSLPAEYDVPRPYATAPTDRTRPLLEAYGAARDASVRAADALAAVAIATDAPSSALALARAAADPHRSSSPEGRDQRRTPEAAAPEDPHDAAVPQPGPVERTIRSLKVTDPIVLLRAAAIDTAARTLISQAEQMSGQPDRQDNDPATAQRHSSSDAARLAAKDNPPRLAGRLAGSETGNHAQVAARRLRAGHAPQPPRAPRL